MMPYSLKIRLDLFSFVMSQLILRYLISELRKNPPMTSELFSGIPYCFLKDVERSFQNSLLLVVFPYTKFLMQSSTILSVFLSWPSLKAYMKTCPINSLATFAAITDISCLLTCLFDSSEYTLGRSFMLTPKEWNAYLRSKP